MSMKLVNADGSDLAPLGTLVFKVKIGDIKSDHPFIVVDHLSIPVILGCDFLTKHGVVVDFAHHIFSCSGKPKVGGKLMLSGTNSCMLVIDTDLPQAIPSKTSVPESDSDLPTDNHPSLESVLQEHRAIFRSQLACATVAEHVIETGDVQPVKVLAHPIPSHLSLRNVCTLSSKKWQILV